MGDRRRPPGAAPGPRSAPRAPRASARCSSACSPGSRSSWTTSRSSAWRKRVVALVVGLDDVAGGRLAQRLAQRARLEAGGLGQQRVVEAAAGRRARAATSWASVGRPRCAPGARRAASAGSAPRPSRPAASSSSVNSGLPSLRAYMRSTSAASGAAPRMSASCSASSSRVSGASSMRRARGAALELGQQRAQRVAAVQLVGAVGGDDAARARRAGCGRGRRRKARVEASAQWRSSIASSTGVVARRAGRAARAAPRRRATAPARRGPCRRRRGRRELGQEAREPGPRGRAELVEHGVAVAREGSQRGDDGRVGQLVLPEGDALPADDARPRRERSALQLLQRAASCLRPTHPR